MRQVPRCTLGIGAIARIVALVLCLTIPTSCISTWNERPHPPSNVVAAQSRDTLYYDIRDTKGMFGGGEALREAFPKKAPFAQVEPLSEPPARGPFCRVTTERRAPHVASGVFGYLSASFLFLIPFWSEEGYLVRYQAYVDGQEKKIFEYPIARTSFFWIVVLPFSWVNLFTASEADAFRATVKQFYADALPYYRGERPWPAENVRAND